jgi:transposase
MSTGLPISKSTKQSIIQYHRGGKTRAEIARLVDVSLRTVDRVLENYATRAPQTVERYRCKGCRALLDKRPCLYCTLRAGR